MRVLLIEADPNVTHSVELMLKAEKFIADTTDEGVEGIDLAKLYDYDAIVLGDVPDLIGPDILKSLRNGRVKTPILVLSRHVNVENVVAALTLGADDYLVKPFYSDEMVVRIHAIVRRSKGHAQSVIRVGDVAVNIDTKTVEVAGRDIHLTTKEYQILELLALRKNTTMTKDMFLNHVYGGFDEPEAKIIDVFMCKLRKKIGQGVIETVWGRGYVMRDRSAGDGADVADFANAPPTGVVSDMTFSEKREAARKMGRIKAPSIVPAAGVL